MTMQTMEKNRLQIMPKEISGIIKPIITAIKNQIEKFDNKLSKLIDKCDEYKAKNTIIQSMLGIDNVLFCNLLSDMIQLGYLTNKETAPLIGVTPFNKESASYEVQRNILVDVKKYVQVCILR